MDFILTGYKKIQSKKNNKTYIVYYLLIDKVNVCECFSEYSEMLEQFIIDNLMEDISEYVKLSYVANINGFKPYVKYN